MNLRDANTLFAFNEWAHARLLGCIDRLTEEQISRPLGGSFTNLRDTLAHIVGAEALWLERWQGTSPTSFPAWLPTATYAELKEILTDVGARRHAFLSRLTEEDLDRPLAYRNLAGVEAELPLSVLFQHLVNHSSYHRGQIVTLLRQLGAEATGTDYVLYQLEMRKG